MIGTETVREFSRDQAREAHGRMLVARGRVLVARGRTVQAQGKARKATRRAVRQTRRRVVPLTHSVQESAMHYAGEAREALSPRIEHAREALSPRIEHAREETRVRGTAALAALRGQVPAEVAKSTKSTGVLRGRSRSSVLLTCLGLAGAATAVWVLRQRRMAAASLGGESDAASDTSESIAVPGTMTASSIRWPD